MQSYYNMGMPTYNDIQPFEAEFNLQMQSKRDILQMPVFNHIINDWQQNKQQIVLGVMQSAQRQGRFINQGLISQAIYRYIAQTIDQYNRGLTPNAMPMGGMNTNPYITGYQPVGGMGNISMQYQAMQSSIANAFQPTTMAYDSPTQTQQTTQPVASDQKETKEDNALHVVAAKHEFKCPINDEADAVFGSEQHDCAIGAMKITAMIDGMGERLKYVDMKLHDSCQNTVAAIERAKLLFNPKNTNYHLNITYDKMVKIDIPVEKFANIIGQMRQAISRATKAKNKLNYLKSIAKILNAECRGVADAVENFLLGEFLKIAKHGCVDSDHFSTEFGVASIMDLIELADKDTSVPVAQAWQKTPGFSERLVDIANETIKHIVEECVILDPSNVTDIGKIIRSYAGWTVNSEGEIIDVITELNDKRDDYCKASTEDKINLYGAAGKLVAESTIIIIPDQQVVVTTFTPECTLGKHNGYPVAVMQECGFGGKDSQGVPNECTSTFEYLMMKMSLTEDKYTKVVVNFDDTLCGSFDCIKTTDDWYMLIPAAIN